MSALAGLALPVISCLPGLAGAAEPLSDDELQTVVARGGETAESPGGHLDEIRSLMPADGTVAGQVSAMLGAGDMDAEEPLKLMVALMLPSQLFDFRLETGDIIWGDKPAVKALADGGFEAPLPASISYIRLLRLGIRGQSTSLGDVELVDMRFSGDSTVRVSFF